MGSTDPCFTPKLNRPSFGEMKTRSTLDGMTRSELGRVLCTFFDGHGDRGDVETHKINKIEKEKHNK